MIFGPDKVFIFSMFLIRGRKESERSYRFYMMSFVYACALSGQSAM